EACSADRAERGGGDRDRGAGGGWPVRGAADHVDPGGSDAGGDLAVGVRGDAGDVEASGVCEFVADSGRRHRQLPFLTISLSLCLCSRRGGRDRGREDERAAGCIERMRTTCVHSLSLSLSP